jgi:hypothetical protein
MKMYRILAAFLIPWLIGGCAIGDANQPPRKTTVCSIVDAPLSLHGRVVEITAFVESDGREHTMLVDRSCRKGIVVVAGELKHDDLSSLKDALRSGKRIGTFDIDVKGTFVGVYRWNPLNRARRTIELLSAKDIAVSTKVATEKQ